MGKILQAFYSILPRIFRALWPSADWQDLPVSSASGGPSKKVKELAACKPAAGEGPVIGSFSPIGFLAELEDSVSSDDPEALAEIQKSVTTFASKK